MTLNLPLQGIVFLSVIASIYGFLHQNLASIPVWSSEVLFQFFQIFIGYSVLIGIAFRYRLSLLASNLFFLILFLLIFIGSKELFALLLVFCSASIFGQTVRRYFNDNTIESKDVFIPFVIINTYIGFALLIPVFYTFAHFKVNSHFLHMSIWVLPVLLCRQSRQEFLQKLFIEFSTTLEDDKPKENLLAILLGAWFFITLLYTLLPETFHDAVSVYFYILEFIRSQGYWHFDISRAIYANMSLGPVWLEVSAYIIGGEHTSKLLCWMSILASTLLIYYALIRDNVNRTIAILAGFIFASTSLSFLLSVSMFYDSFLIAFITSAFFLLTSSIKKIEFVVISILIAGAAASKATAFFPGTAILIFSCTSLILIKRVNALSTYGIAALFFIVIALPGYAFNYVQTGNPFFPLLNDIFKSPFYEAVPILSPLTGKLTLKSIYDFTFKTSEYLESEKGGFGFHFLIMLPAMLLVGLIKIKERFGKLVLTFFVFATLQAKLDPNLRYLAPFMPIFIILGVSAISSTIATTKLKQQLLLLIMLTCVYYNIKFSSSSCMQLANVSPYTILYPNLELSYLKSFGSQQVLAKKVVTNYAGRPKILSLNAGGLGSVNADVVSYNWYNSDLFYELLNCVTNEDFNKVFKKWAITHVIERPDSEYYNFDNLHKYFNEHARVILTEGSNLAYQLPDEIILPREYITNSGFDSGIDRWELSQVKEYHSSFKGAEILPNGYVSQNFPVEENKWMQLKVAYLCDRYPQILAGTAEFFDSASRKIGDSRFYTICPKQGGLAHVIRDFSPIAETASMRISFSGLGYGIKIDSVSIKGW